MAVTAGTRSFWGALLSVLLKCVAALRLTPAARTAAAASATTAPAATTLPASTASVRTATASGTATVPEPRLPYLPHLPQQSRRRAHTLPPTMKQRISAEAHGSSPSVRGLAADGLLADGRYTGSVTIAAPPA